jgi:hypothetical protein
VGIPSVIALTFPSISLACVILITYKNRTEREDGFGEIAWRCGDVECQHNKFRQWGMDSRELV